MVPYSAMLSGGCGYRGLGWLWGYVSGHGIECDIPRNALLSWRNEPLGWEGWQSGRVATTAVTSLKSRIGHAPFRQGASYLCKLFPTFLHHFSRRPTLQVARPSRVDALNTRFRRHDSPLIDLSIPPFSVPSHKSISIQVRSSMEPFQIPTTAIDALLAQLNGMKRRLKQPRVFFTYYLRTPSKQRRLVLRCRCSQRCDILKHQMLHIPTREAILAGIIDSFPL